MRKMNKKIAVQTEPLSSTEGMEMEEADGAEMENLAPSEAGKDEEEEEEHLGENNEDECDLNVNNEDETDLDNGEQDEEDELDQQPTTSTTITESGKRKKKGVVYIQTVPPQFTVTKLREALSKFATIERIFLQAERQVGKRRKRYTEGWVEFASKSAAKRVAKMLNGNQVGGKRRSAAYDTLWTMKYLSGFKWTHLMEQLEYEKRVEQQRLRAELSQAKRRAEHFAEQVEKGERIRSLEEKMLKKGGLWERYQRQVRQRQVIRDTEKAKALNADENFMRMIFDKQ